AIRFGANTAAEDEQDLDKVSLNLELFEAYARGYLAEAGSALWQKEKDTLAFGAWLMTMECGMRFLADYLNGDSYFGAKYPEHNLVRARNQFALAADIERKMDKMEEIIAKY
ncbi:MAG: mucin-desulfating sulfatase, partial [Oscillospiraceae bacterium]|nr:mucin-desulfating sulfatase [Oscillospiraceae bacterium]